MDIVGHINKMAGFYIDTLNEDAIVIRLNGPSFGVIDRQREMKYQLLLQENNITDYLLGIFKNGIVMQHIAGSALTHLGNLTPEIEEKIARKFSNLHQKVPVIEKFIIGGVDRDHILSK